MGKAYVDRAFREADEFSIDLQHYVTEHGWGASWARGVLPMKTRSMMSLAMIMALNGRSRSPALLVRLKYG